MNRCIFLPSSLHYTILFCHSWLFHYENVCLVYGRHIREDNNNNNNKATRYYICGEIGVIYFRGRRNETKRKRCDQRKKIYIIHIIYIYTEMRARETSRWN